MINDDRASVLRELAAIVRDRAGDVTEKSWNPDAHVEITLSIADCRRIVCAADLVHRTDAYGNPCTYTKAEAARLDDVERQMDEAEWRSVGVRIEHDEEGPSVWVDDVCMVQVDQRKDKAMGYDACLDEQERVARAIAREYARSRTACAHAPRAFVTVRTTSRDSG